MTGSKIGRAQNNSSARRAQKKGNVIEKMAERTSAINCMHTQCIEINYSITLPINPDYSIGAKIASPFFTVHTISDNVAGKWWVERWNGGQANSGLC